MKDENVHGPQLRETKESQARPAAPVSDLFRLDGRTIVGKTLEPTFFASTALLTGN